MLKEIEEIRFVAVFQSCGRLMLKCLCRDNGSAVEDFVRLENDGKVLFPLPWKGHSH